MWGLKCPWEWTTGHWSTLTLLCPHSQSPQTPLVHYFPSDFQSGRSGVGDICFLLVRFYPKYFDSPIIRPLHFLRVQDLRFKVRKRLLSLFYLFTVVFVFCFFSFKNENRMISLPQQRKGLKVKGKRKRKSVNISWEFTLQILLSYWLSARQAGRDDTTKSKMNRSSVVWSFWKELYNSEGRIWEWNNDTYTGN